MDWGLPSLYPNGVVNSRLVRMVHAYGNAFFDYKRGINSSQALFDQ